MNQPAPAHPGSLRLGLRANLAQFSLLVGVNALVGGMVGQERSLLSLLATQVFGRTTDPHPDPDRTPGAADSERPSTRLGRKPLITAGMLVQAVALAGTALASSFAPWAASAILFGIGTAMVYPTLLAAISDVAHPSWRATAVGVYRLWRHAGFAVGALLAGLVADLAGLDAAIWVIAALTAASGILVAVRMYETHP
jgi:MFS family permease